MSYELKIRFDGNVKGLAQHRLSIDQFGKPMELLLVALKRIATDIVQATSEKRKVGRFKDIVDSLDIELSQIIDGSTGFIGTVSFNQPPQGVLFGDLAERSGVELVNALEQESKGHPRNYAVRNYLQSLPPALTSQEYEFKSDGELKAEAKIGNVRLPEIPPDLPVLRKHEGNIVEVGFEPGRTEIRVKEETISPALLTSSEMVEKALKMRSEKVRTIAVHIPGKSSRLVSLKRASTPPHRFDPMSAKNRMFARWDKVLRALSK